MAVELGQIKTGAVFSFKVADRRVISTSKPTDRGFNVKWEYADGQKRGGKLGGEQWCHYFRKEAIAEVPGDGEETRTLRSGRTVACEKEVRTVSLQTRCPAKWALVDLETGDVWVDDAGMLKRASHETMRDLKMALPSTSPAKDLNQHQHLAGE